MILTCVGLVVEERMLFGYIQSYSISVTIAEGSTFFLKACMF